MDWRQPWRWPRSSRVALFLSAGIGGALLLSPWCLDSWQLWDDAHQTQARWLQQQDAIDALRVQTAQLLQVHGDQPSVSFADVTVLTDLAQQQGLQLSQLGLDRPQQSPVLKALHMQQLPVQLHVQGSWQSWLNWLAQWPKSAPGVTVSSLELKADARGGISAQMLAVAPQSTVAETAFELSGIDLASMVTADPFNATGWANVQRVHAEQHPSYANLVEPELVRPRDWLESLPRDRLQYVGQIASGAEVYALVKVLPLAGAKPGASMMSVHRVRVGSHMGQNFGKVIAVQPDEFCAAWLPVVGVC